MRALADKQHSQLYKTILAHDTGLLWLEKRCKEDATTYSKNAKQAQTDGFSSYRSLLAGAFNKWARRMEKLDTEQSNRLTQETDKNDKAAWKKAEHYDSQYIQAYGGQSEERKEVQHDAVYEIARDYSQEIWKTKTEFLPELSKATSEAIAQLFKARDQALVEYDKGLPIVLTGIDGQLAAALQDISNKTQEVRVMLAKGAIQMHERVNVLKDTALKRNAAFHTKIDGQIEAGRAGAAQELRRAVPAAMKPIATIVDDAVGILTNSGEALDVDASEQFVDEVVDFSLDAADAAGVVFGAARDAGVGTLARAVPFGKRGLAAGKQDLEAAIHTEGGENELALIAFSGRAEEYLKVSLTALDETFNAAVMESGTKLELMLNETREGLREPAEQTEEKIRQSVTDVLIQQSDAKSRLWRAMDYAARMAAWRYDHPIRAGLARRLEIFLGVVAAGLALAALIFALPFILGAEAAAVVLFIVGMVGAFFIGYFGAKAYDERRKADPKGSQAAAFFGAIADVTGITDVRRAFTDEKMSDFERGFVVGNFLLSSLWRCERRVAFRSGNQIAAATQVYESLPSEALDRSHGAARSADPALGAGRARDSGNTDDRPRPSTRDAAPTRGCQDAPHAGARADRL